MTEEFQSEIGLPIGRPVPDWHPCPVPPAEPMNGRWCSVVPIDPDQHGRDLYRAFSEDREDRIWTYLPYGPFRAFTSFRQWMEETCLGEDPKFFAILPAETGQAAGVASYLRIASKTGVIEIGHINYSLQMQRSPAATEAACLMVRNVFDLGYRRCEWKCDALNERSRRAAIRLGFRFEGVFRNATIYKGRNRDSAWYSIIDSEWPTIDRAHRRWLSPLNFDSSGMQKSALGTLIDSEQSSA